MQKAYLVDKDYKDQKDHLEDQEEKDLKDHLDSKGKSKTPAKVHQDRQDHQGKTGRLEPEAP